MTSHSEHLEVRFTDAEKLEMGRDVARLNQEKRRLDQKLGEIKKQLTGEIAAKETEIDRLMDLLSNGYEYRQVECRVDLDTPKPGQASVIRLDTEEVVRVRRMNDEELQIQLPLEEAPPEAEPSVEPAIEPEPVAEVVVEPDPIVPAELRRFEYTNVGCAASIVVFSDEYGKIRCTATASIEGLEPFDAGNLGYAETVGEAAREGVLAMYRWAKDINANSKPGLAKAVSMAIITWGSNILGDVKNGAV